MGKRMSHKLGKWQYASIVFFGSILFGLPAALFPSPAFSFFVVTLLLAVVAFLVAVKRGKPKGPDLTIFLMWMFAILVEAARLFELAAGTRFVFAFAAVLLLFLLTIAVSFRYPKLTIFLYREQTQPKTPLGRRFLAVILYLAPIAAIVGAQAGRTQPKPATWWVVAVLSLLIALLGLQSAIAQYIMQKETK